MLPLRSLSRAPTLWRISWVGCLLAIAQACWVTFAVIYLVAVLGLSLSVAGLVFAVMQATSVAGRMVLGRIADHAVSSTTTLAIASIGSALSTIAFGLADPGSPIWAFVVLAAVAALGVRLERRSDCGGSAPLAARDRRRDAAGSVILVFASNMLAPVVFAAFVALTDRYDHASSPPGRSACFACIALRDRSQA